MMYMIAFWIVMGMLIVFDFFIKKRCSYNVTSNTNAILLSAAFSLLAGAIITKDPIFSAWGIPPEFDWIVGMFIGGVWVWRSLIRPLADKVEINEKNVIILQENARHTNEDIHQLKRDVSVLKQDMSFVKASLDSLTKSFNSFLGRRPRRT